MKPAIELKEITKDFKTDFWKPTIRGLHGVSFQVPEGKIFGLIGHNGAGKTTCIKIMLGLLRPTAGNIEILGRSITDQEIRKEVGYLPENAYYYEFLTAGEILDFYAKLFGLRASDRRKKVDELLELVGLGERKNDKLKTFSKGMLQRVGIAQAMINNPKLVILDEPMSGLDPIGRKEVRDIMVRLSEQNKTILFSSHILSDIEAICDEVAILVRGKLIASGALSKLVRAKVKSVEVAFEIDEDASSIEPWEEEMTLRRVGSRLVVTSPDLSKLSDILEKGKKKGWVLQSVIPHKESLEDLFMEKSGGNG